MASIVGAIVCAHVGLLLLLGSIPMALGLVKPNGVYGFRTARTLSDPRIWELANRAAGRAGMAAGSVMLVVGVVLAATQPPWADTAADATICCALVFTVAYSFLKLRKIK